MKTTTKISQTRLKRLLFIATLLVQVCFYASAQNNLSTSAKSVLEIIEKQGKGKNPEMTAQVQQELGIIHHNQVPYIAALIKVDYVSIDTKALNNLGVITNTKAGDIWTVQVPIHSFPKLPKVNGIKAIDTGGKMKLLLDEVRTETKAAEVYQGLNLSHAYFGENVVVGMIDAGFDYTHPTFYDPLTKQCRISRVWNQTYNEAQAGLGFAPPAGYNYGMELINPGEIIKNIDTSEYKNPAKKFYLYDGQDETHGTHTTGIAAGSGWETNGKYQGIAPKAEIVMVSFDGNSETISASKVMDAMQYIYNYAASVHKPAVINFSAGTQIGPHDGTSLLCQGINNLTGEGKLMVGAAGNDGGAKIHLSHSFSTADTVFSLLATEEEGKVNASMGPGDNLTDCWASAGTDFSVKVIAYKNDIKIGETKFVAASLNNSITETINDGINAVTIKLTTEAANPNNHKPNILIDIMPPPINQLSFELAFAGSNTTVHAWSRSSFLGRGKPRYIDGDDLYTIVDGQTAENVIAAGAYAARNKYTNIYNKVISLENEATVGNIAYFSSKGPTVDGRTKPDITAPGFEVISSISSFKQDYEGEYMNTSVAYKLISPLNGRIYKYASESGTSMSSPVTAGAVALILEANPKLDPQQVITILKNTARTDNFTGNIPFAGSNTWGWGKIDIHEAVKAAEAIGKPADLLASFTYPNPATDAITVVLPEQLKNKPCSYTIYNICGKQFMSNTALSNSFTVPVSNLPGGLYLLKLRGSTTITGKFIKQ